MSFISDKTIDTVKEVMKVEEVIQEFLQLKKAGSGYSALCPFHDEKTPSFSVSPAKNIYKCFGCGRSGDPIRFVMDHEHMGYVDAIRYLAKKYNIPIEEKQLDPEERKERQLKESLYLVNEFAQKFYQDQLMETDAGKSIGYAYFKNRGFTKETIQKFGLGFAPRGPKALQDAAQIAQYKPELLNRLGLVTKTGNDFFRDRVMFPIHGLSGKVVAFAGRILQKNIKAPKYINSPESEIYVKSNVLYGAYFAREAIRRQDLCYLVEGYTDVMALHQAGIKNVVASSGTSLTPGQVKLIKRFTNNITLLFDGDKAGLNAALRGVDIILTQDVNARVVVLPENQDPDSFLQEVGEEQFLDFLTQKAKDFILFKADFLLAGAANDPIRKASVIQDVVRSIALIPNQLQRSLYIKHCADMFELEEAILHGEINKVLRTAFSRFQKKQERQTTTQQPIAVSPKKAPPKEEGPLRSRERNLAQKLIQFCEAQLVDQEEQIPFGTFILSNVQDVLEGFNDPLSRAILQVSFERINADKPLTHAFFIDHPQEDIRQFSVEVLANRDELSPNWEDKWEITLQTQLPPALNFLEDGMQSIKRLKMEIVRQMLHNNKEKLKATTNPEEMQLLLMVHKDLQKTRNEIAKDLGIVVFQ